MKLLTISLSFLVVVLNASAATNVAASLALADVQAAFAASVAGDSVVLPAGTAIWTNQLYILGKAVSLYGAGKTQTTIVDGWTTGLASQPFIVWENATNGFVRTSGYTINMQAGNAAAAIDFQSPSNYFRADNLILTNLTRSGIYVVGWAAGLVDHCNFYQRPGSSVTGVKVYGEGDYTWTDRAPSWGDTNRVYVEDCTFSWNLNANGAMDTYTGARFCFRHNYCTNINVGCHGRDSTGTASTHSWEIYNNYFTNSTTGNILMMHLRGGTGVVFSNRYESHYIYNTIALANYRCSGTNIYAGGWDPAYAVTGTNWMDGNADQYGYPAYQSIGRTSPLTYVTNSTSTNGLANAFTIQAYSPAYQWSNTYYSHILLTTNATSFGLTQNYTNLPPYDYIPSAYWLVQSNRDYFDYTPKPGYAPLEYPHPLIAQTEGGTEPAEPTSGLVIQNLHADTLNIGAP